MRATPEQVVRAAAAWIAAGRRLDLQLLGAEQGISRATLHRKVGNRDNLLGLALAHRALDALERAERDWERGRRPHELRSLSVIMAFNAGVAADRGLRRLLDDEPMTAVRVLTDSRGHVQPAVVTAFTRLLERDEQEGLLRQVVPFDQLAYAVVRLGESFLYADVIADRPPDVETANTLERALVEAARR
ncbi:MAG TPA: QsdR family transcriptional regulator [Mycobacteriales bacterium]|nr:QsdR family transcriptional regulator [Mycobacteriales bacterium]